MLREHWGTDICIWSGTLKFSEQLISEIWANDNRHLRERNMHTILLVDDDCSLLLAWKRILLLKGFHVETANDGHSGLAAAIRLYPALVITDRSMPGMDGIEFCRQLRRKPRLTETPIILTSASDEIALEAPIWTEYWQKPVTSEKILTSIERLLAHSLTPSESSRAATGVATSVVGHLRSC